MFNSDFEKRAIKASAEVQSLIGCGVTFHPARDPRATFEIIRLYLEAGGKAEKCIMSHLDRKSTPYKQYLAKILLEIVCLYCDKIILFKKEYS